MAHEMVQKEIKHAVAKSTSPLGGAGAGAPHALRSPPGKLKGRSHGQAGRSFELVVPGRLEELQEGDELETGSDAGDRAVVGRMDASARPVGDTASVAGSDASVWKPPPKPANLHMNRTSATAAAGSSAGIINRKAAAAQIDAYAASIGESRGASTVSPAASSSVASSRALGTEPGAAHSTPRRVQYPDSHAGSRSGIGSDSGASSPEFSQGRRGSMPGSSRASLASEPGSALSERRDASHDLAYNAGGSGGGSGSGGGTHAAVLGKNRVASNWLRGESEERPNDDEDDTGGHGMDGIRRDDGAAAPPSPSSAPSGSGSGSESGSSSRSLELGAGASGSGFYGDNFVRSSVRGPPMGRGGVPEEMPHRLRADEDEDKEHEHNDEDEDEHDEDEDDRGLGGSLSLEVSAEDASMALAMKQALAS